MGQQIFGHGLYFSWKLFFSYHCAVGSSKDTHFLPSSVETMQYLQFRNETGLKNYANPDQLER